MKYDYMLKEVADYYGKENQLHQLMEECCELAAECNHSVRKKSITVDLINEIADVEIMLAQIKYLYQISDDDIEEMKDYKITRQKLRILNDKERDI